jgi:hypothetical protein
VSIAAGSTLASLKPELHLPSLPHRLAEGWRPAELIGKPIIRDGTDRAFRNNFIEWLDLLTGGFDVS